MIITQEHIEQLPDDEQLDFMEHEHWEGMDHVAIIEEIRKAKIATWVPQYMVERLNLSGDVVRFNKEGVMVLHAHYKDGYRVGEATYINLDGEKVVSTYVNGVFQGSIG